MIHAIVTDIEGTTTADFFVKEVLFGYAKKRIRRYLTNGQDEPEIAALTQEVREVAGEPDASVKRVIEILKGWIEEDRKEPVLKRLQGMVWEDGYRTRQYLGHIFPDVYVNLTRWHKAGVTLAVYSSGSIFAQQLLLEHTSFGDARPLFKKHYDTGIGAKQEVSSYHSIVEDLGLPAEQVLFLSDTMGELNAARTAGLQTARLLRDPEGDAEDETHHLCYDFEEVNEYLSELGLPSPE